MPGFPSYPLSVSTSEQSSLDRYLLNNGHRLLGLPTTEAGAKFQTSFGAIFTLVSLAVMPLSFIYGWQLAVSMLGPLIAGVVNFFVGWSLLKRTRRPESARVDLSPEAKQLLANLLKQMGGWRIAWSQQPRSVDANPWSMLYEQRGTGAWAHNPPVPNKSSKDILNERAFALLEDAARECNRIQACIAGGTNTAVQKRATDVAAASDEGMGHVLQQASLLDRFPESGQAVETSARQQIVALKEIADRLEALHTREPLLTDRLGSSSAMDRVLDDLRLETLARQELTHDLSEDEQSQQNRG